MFSELKKDAVGAMELILEGSTLDFATVRGLLPLMSDYQLDLLSDQVSYITYVCILHLAFTLVDKLSDACAQVSKLYWEEYTTSRVKLDYHYCILT